MGLGHGRHARHAARRVAYNPLEEPSGGPNYNQFSDDVLYEVHVTRGAKSLEDVLTYQIRFSSTDFPSVVGISRAIAWQL